MEQMNDAKLSKAADGVSASMRFRVLTQCKSFGFKTAGGNIAEQQFDECVAIIVVDDHSPANGTHANGGFLFKNSLSLSHTHTHNVVVVVV
jgi:hypothetical protein